MNVPRGLLRNDAGDIGARGRIAPVSRISPPAPAAADRAALRAVLGRFATGVTVVAAGDKVPRGMTANAFTSVSIDPPLVLVCINRHAQIHQTIVEHGAFAVSVLSAHQEPVARYFADHSRPRGAAEFAAVGWSCAPETGSPILDDALAWIDCRLTASYDGGDHAIFLGSVQACACDLGSDALIFFSGHFHRQHLEPLRESA